MLPYKQKVFRQKPYTQCFQCIQGPKLKCKNCMNAIIADILHHKTPKEPVRKENNPKKLEQSTPTSKRNCTTGQGFKKRQARPQETFEIRTNFGLWVEKIQAKRTNSYDVLGLTLAQWPHRKLNSKQKISKIQQAKFENWESRLLQRFAKNSPEYLKLQKNMQSH